MNALTILQLKNTIQFDILPKLQFIENSIENSIKNSIKNDNCDSLKLLAEVATSLRDESHCIVLDNDNICYARTDKGIRCKHTIKNQNGEPLEVDGMYCHQHCLTYNRTTRNKPKNTLLYGDVRLIGENCFQSKYYHKQFANFLDDNASFKNKIRLDTDYSKLDNRELLFKKLVCICCI
tara:strand:+ start:539 stop:1075 length:537 start_codon:yes stop_codon:yes gene_type:complete